MQHLKLEYILCTKFPYRFSISPVSIHLSQHNATEETFIKLRKSILLIRCNKHSFCVNRLHFISSIAVYWSIPADGVASRSVVTQMPCVGRTSLQYYDPSLCFIPCSASHFSFFNTFCLIAWKVGQPSTKHKKNFFWFIR